jgi:sugar phosphate isomerase/epimerase
LHLHAKEEATRRRTRDYLKELIDFAGDLGAPAMVLGSNRQRYLEEGDFAGAWSRTKETLGSLTAHLAARDVALCPEALPAPDCDFLQTSREAAQMVAELDHSQIRLMLDAKSLSAEPRPPAETIRALGRGIAHFHANDANRRAPGYGDTDFCAIAAALRDVEYTGVISIEPFDYWPDPQTLARESLAYLKSAFGETR